MKRNFLLSTDAEQDIFAIARYIGNDSPQAAGRFLEVFEHACDMLSDLSEMSSITFENYLVFYRPLTKGKIEIVRVVHGARDLPALFGDNVEGGDIDSPEHKVQSRAEKIS